MTKTVIMVAVLILGAAAVYALYTYEETPDAPVGPVVSQAVAGAPTFTWSYRNDEDEAIPYTEITLTATYENGTSESRVIDTIEGNCAVYEPSDSDVYERSTMIMCYYAGFGRYYKVVANDTDYAVQRREFEEASPEYDPPVQPYVTIERF